MKLIKKIINIPTGETKEVESGEVWVVSWKAWYGEFSSDYVMKFRPFYSKKEAKDFKEQIINANNLIGNNPFLLSVSLRKEE